MKKCVHHSLESPLFASMKHGMPAISTFSAQLALFKILETRSDIRLTADKETHPHDFFIISAESGDRVTFAALSDVASPPAIA